MLPSKVEIKLKKAVAVTWRQLEYPKIKSSNVINQPKDLETNSKNSKSDSFVESVDLSDL